MSKKNIILSAENLSYAYPDGSKALNGLNINLQRGKITVLLGANGAGKSTLFLTLNGILRPESGDLTFDGKPYDYTKKGLLHLKEKIGIVFQDPDNQLFSASVEQDISFGVFNQGYKEDEVRKRVDEIMEKVGITALKDKPTHALSYGQKKRVAIAGVLVMEPEIIILDEPTAGLDPEGVRSFLSLIQALNEEHGITILIATHNIDLVPELADYIYVIKKGQALFEGEVQDVMAQRDVLLEAGLAIPRITQLFEKLKADGKVNDLAHDVDTAYQMLKGRV